MRTSAIFIIVTLFIPMILSVRVSADRFSEIRDSIQSFCDSITSEGVEANRRYEEEKKWCAAKIQEAEELVAKRTREVESLEKQKKGLEDKIEDNNKAIKHYQDKIDENNANMKKFKSERCDANFNFISLLREHYDAEELLKALKKELDDYLDKKIANPEDASAKLPTAFLQKVRSIGHLLPADKQKSLIQLVDAANKYVQAGDVSGAVQSAIDNQYEARTIDNTLHVDNDREELKALEHVKHLNPVEYFSKLKLKIDNIIDGLIQHLSDSKDDLSTKEMLANEDYAKFMIALDKENKELAKLIADLQAENVTLTEQLKKTVETLEEFRKLLQAAIDNLEYLRRICREKDEYHASEETRRAKETSQCAEAAKIFEDIVGSDEELKKLLNKESDLNKSDIVEKRDSFEAKRAANKAEDIKIVF